MSLNKIRIILLSTSMFLILIVLGLTGAMNIATFQQNYNESLAANYKVLAEKTVRKIEFAVKYGKPLDNFYGIEKLLSENLHNVEGLEEVQVVLPGGDIIYNQDGNVTERKLPAEMMEKVRFFQSSTENDAIYYLDEKNYYVYSPIHDNENRWIASLGLIFSESVVKAELKQYLYTLIYYFVGFSITSFILLLIFLCKVPIISSTNTLFKKRISIIILAILGGAQVIYGAINYFSLKNGYLELVTKNNSLALNVIQSDIEEVINKGVPYSELHGVGDYMNEMIKYLPEVSRISIINADFTTENTNEELFISKYSYSSPLIADSSGRSNYIHVVDLSKSHIDKKMQGILLDTLTMIVLSFLLIMEMIVFVLLYLEKQVKNLVLTIEKKEDEERMFIRPLSFIVFSAAFLSSAYIPILMKDIQQSFLGLPAELIFSLPIGLEALLVFIGFMVASPLNDRIGWRITFILGLLILLIGTLASALSWSQETFIISRMISGTGFGFSLLAMYRYCYRTTFKSDNQETFTQFQIGSISGMYLGIVIGAMLAEKIGYFNTYFLAIPLLLLAIFLVLKFIPNHIEKRVIRRRIHYRTLEERQAFFKNKHVVSFWLLIIIPIATASMFLFYLFPIFADMKELSLANIGRVFLLQGMIMIYLRSLNAQHVIKLIKLKTTMLISASFVAIGLLVFSFQLTLISAMIAITLLGLANGIGLTAQLEYFKKLHSSTKIENRIMTYYKPFALIGKAVGISIFVSSFLLFGYSLGIAVIGVGVLLTTLLFVSITRKEMTVLEVRQDENK